MNATRDRSARRDPRLEFENRETLTGIDMKHQVRFSSALSFFAQAGLVWLAGIATACGGSELEQRDLGDTGTGSVFDPSERSPLATSDGKLDSFVEGHWVGQAEDMFRQPDAQGQRPAYVFPSGSTEIMLDLSMEKPTFQQLGGQIIFGQGPVPEPAAGVVYPAGLQNGIAGDLSAAPPLEGFAYRVLGYPVPDGVLWISYTPTESYRDWCPLQPSRWVEDRYSCVTLSEDPSAGCNGEEMKHRVHYDCRLEWLCQACTCTQAGCTVSYAAPSVELFLSRSGDDLIGSLVRAVFDYGSTQYLPVGNVRFQRREP